MRPQQQATLFECDQCSRAQAERDTAVAAYAALEAEVRAVFDIRLGVAAEALHAIKVAERDGKVALRAFCVAKLAELNAAQGSVTITPAAEGSK